MKLIGRTGLTMIILAAIVAFASVRASAQTESSPPAAFAPYVEMIRELDLRRRVNVLYPNPQSLFDGLQVGFVNTTTGNLTFRRRDIVTRAQGPVVFARVYDSRIGANADFGTGWRISLAEELLVDADTVTYIDEAGARHTFASHGKAYAASPPTPRHVATTLSFADADGTRIATLVDGDTMRTFERADEAGTRYVVKTVKTGSRELVFDYHEGRQDGVVPGRDAVAHGTPTVGSARSTTATGGRCGTRTAAPAGSQRSATSQATTGATCTVRAASSAVPRVRTTSRTSRRPTTRRVA